MPVRMLPIEETKQSGRMRALTRMIRDESRVRPRRICTSKPIEHGTRYAYCKHACRCDDCSAANAAYSMARCLRLAAGKVPKHLHGTDNAYVHFRCRCGPCKSAHSAVYARRKRCARGRACRRIVTGLHRKYCCEQCRIDANVENRRAAWRKSWDKKKAAKA